MGLFDKLRNAFSGPGSKPDDEYKRTINTIFAEYTSRHGQVWSVDLNETPTWTNEVRNWPDKKKIGFIKWLVQGISGYMQGRTSWSSFDKDFQRYNLCQACLQSLFRNKLLMDDDDVAKLYGVFSKHQIHSWSVLTHWPVSLMLNQLEKQRKGQVASPLLREVLTNIKNDIAAVRHRYEEKERIKMVEKIDRLLFVDATEPLAIKPARLLGQDRLADLVNPAIERMLETERLIWYKLLPLIQRASGSKPSKKYLDGAKVLMNELGVDKFRKVVHEWLQFLVDLKVLEERKTIEHGNGQRYTYTEYEYITSVNADAMKGLVWTCSHFRDNATVQIVAALAERAFKKIPEKGPTAASVGNACLYVLYKSKGLDGIGQLSRLKTRIRQNSTLNIIDKYLLAAAEEQGVAVSEIEDMAVDDCGFVKGGRLFIFDEYKAGLAITGVGKIELKWFKPDGIQQKTIPAIIKEKHAAKLKKVKNVSKQAEQILVAQRDRMDKMFREGRRIAWENFVQYYMGHGLVGYLTQRVIWNFHRENNTVQAICLNGHWVNADSEPVSAEAIPMVSLWHPVQASADEIKKWREFLVFHQLQQPLKQAYREIYLLTDAEVNTKSYSNRMAAHILRQHQFNSLAKARGWRYALMGAFDNRGQDYRASLLLPQYGLRAEYWICEVNADEAMNNSGIWNYVSTDQVRFVNTVADEPIDLVDVLPLVFSEVMRDVDLFVGVASVGNDPAWSDSGGIPAYRDYWTSYSFGELSEIAKSRKGILENLLPRLKIRDVAVVRDKFLIVRGKLRTYKIHIGSGNILMEPNDQYLCIVPDRSQKNHTENLFLPFEGDNGLSVILSKAFLLADDNKIQDTTIISQINSK